MSIWLRPPEEAFKLIPWPWRRTFMMLVAYIILLVLGGPSGAVKLACNPNAMSVIDSKISSIDFSREYMNASNEGFVRTMEGKKTYARSASILFSAAYLVLLGYNLTLFRDKDRRVRASATFALAGAVMSLAWSIQQRDVPFWSNLG